MKKLIFSFIILVVLLFLGIFIMIKPTSFITSSGTNHIESSDQPLAGRIVPKAIMMLGSALTVTGVVGLSIVGFVLFKESEHQDTNTRW